MTPRQEPLAHVVHIGRIIVRGARGLGQAELRTRIETAVTTAIADAGLPAGRTVRAEVVVSSGPLLGSAAVAGAVGDAIAAAISKGRTRG